MANIDRDRIKRTVATGYGRISVPFAERRVTEISCHALGAYHIFPDTRTVIDVGGSGLQGYPGWRRGEGCWTSSMNG